MTVNNPLMLLRGPLIVFSVLSALLAPFIAQLSVETLGLLGLLLVGLGVTLWDVFSCVSQQSRSYLSHQIDKFVLDDVLKALFDPEVGLIPNCVGSFLGSSAMYSLASSDEQRVRLLQSGIWVRDPEIARNVLYQPGGIKLLFPPLVLQWLESSSSSSSSSSSAVATTPASKAINKVIVEDVGWTEKSHGSSDDDDESATALYEEEKNNIRNNFCSATDASSPLRRVTASRFSAGTSTTDRNAQRVPSTIQTNPPLPHEVLGSVIMENVREKLVAAWNEMRLQTDRSTLTMTASTAALLLVLQLKTSRKARDIVLSALQSFTAMSLSSIAMVSGAMLCASYWDERKLSLSVIKDTVTVNLRRNWKAWLATLFVLYMRQRQGSRHSFR